MNGIIINHQFTTGLDNLMGIAIHGDLIYVFDVTQLVAINSKTGKIAKRYALGREQFLNDVAVDQDGNIYVSDMGSSSIYKLDKYLDYTQWNSSQELENPNGLLAVGTDLYVAAWGFT